ncbi:MAG: hypothetical protein VX353_02240 [Actinomycetota bacterium]
MSYENSEHQVHLKKEIFKAWTPSLRGKEYEDLDSLLNELSSVQHPSIDALSSIDLYDYGFQFSSRIRKDILDPPISFQFFGLPRSIASVFGALISEMPSELENVSVLDTWVTPGGLLREVERNMAVQSSVGFLDTKVFSKTHYPDMAELCKFVSVTDVSREYVETPYYFPGLYMKGVREFPFQTEPLSRFDIVISAPLLNSDSSVGGTALFDNGISLRDDEISLGFLRSALQQSEGGYGFYFLPEKFFQLRGEESVIENLDKFNLYIDGIFHIPASGFQTSNLVIVRRGKSGGKVFIGEASHPLEEFHQSHIEEIKPNLELVKSYWEGSWRGANDTKSPNVLNDKRLLFGAGIDLSNFRGFVKLKDDIRLKANFKETGFPVRQLSEIASIQPLEITDIQFFFTDREDNASSIFLKRVISKNSKYVASNLEEVIFASDMDDLKRLNTDWVRLEIDLSQIDKETLIRYLSGELGYEALGSKQDRTIREVTPLSIEDLLGVEICIPKTLGEQVEYNSVVEEIKRFTDMFQNLGKDIENKPQTYPQIRKYLNEVDAKLGQDRWFETLPSPLSTVLWRYKTYGDKRVEDKVKALQHFFEVLLLFLTCVVMGGARQDPDFKELHEEMWKRRISELMKVTPLQNMSLGQMKIILEVSSKKIRSDLNNKNEKKGLTRNFWQEKFACENLELLGEIVGKRILTVFEKSVDLRNIAAHEAITNNETLTKRLEDYESLLEEVELIFQTHWESYPLIIPTASHKSQGRWTVEAKSLIGPHIPYKEVTYQLSDGLDEEYLHLVNPTFGYSCPLPLLIRLGDSPKTPESNFYFYNKKEGDDEMKYVSYHSEDNPTQYWKLEECGILKNFFTTN